MNISYTKVNVGVINLMPDLQRYHIELLDAFREFSNLINFYWIRLESKNYNIDYQEYVNSTYKTFPDLLSNIDLDAIIITGAPLEQIEFHDVEYWDELQSIIAFMIRHDRCCLGLCWGGLALAKVMGIGKVRLNKKIFGVYSLINSAPIASRFSKLNAEVNMPFSIQAKLDEADVLTQVETKEMHVIAGNSNMPHSLLQSSDQRHTICLGHPEYTCERLIKEWHRDLSIGKSQNQPFNVDMINPNDYWRRDSNLLFGLWLEKLLKVKFGANQSSNSKMEV